MFYSATVSGRLLSSVLREQVHVDGLVQSHAAGQDMGQLALRHVQAGRAQVLRDVHHSHDSCQQHGPRMKRRFFFFFSVSRQNARHYLPQGGYAFAFVSLSVSRITLEVVDEF